MASSSAEGEPDQHVVLLQFVPFHSSLDPGFWHELSKRKLEEYRLSEEPVPINGYYTNSRLIPTQYMSLDYCAFDGDPQLSTLDFPAPGLLRNTNTLSSFTSLDKKALIESIGQTIWDAINDGSALTNPSKLNTFVLITYADLKKYNYYYWFEFPALSPDQTLTCKTIRPLSDAYSSSTIAK